MGFGLSDISVSMTTQITPIYKDHSSLPGVFVLTVSTVVGCGDQAVNNVYQFSIPLIVIMCMKQSTFQFCSVLLKLDYIGAIRRDSCEESSLQLQRKGDFTLYSIVKTYARCRG